MAILSVFIILYAKKNVNSKNLKKCTLMETGFWKGLFYFTKFVTESERNDG